MRRVDPSDKVRIKRDFKKLVRYMAQRHGLHSITYIRYLVYKDYRESLK